MKYENDKIYEWTDGGNVSNRGYFDGAGKLEKFFSEIFLDVMGDVNYGTKCKITFKIETIPETSDN